MEKYSGNAGRTTILSDTFNQKKASIITNRGCYFSCSFCASRTIFPRSMRFRTTENVISEIKQLNNQYGINFLVIEDDLFTADKKLCLDFLRSIKTLNIKDLEIQFPNDLNINTTDEEIFDAMIDCGLKVAHLAIESGSNYVQKHIITKGVTLSKVKPHVEYLQSKGILVRCIYILGFPGETVEQMRETINFAKSINSDWSIFNIATPLLGTPMAQQFIDLGYVSGDLEILSETDFKSRAFDTPEISAQDLNNLQYRTNLEINFINNRQFITGNYENAVSIFEQIYKQYPQHIIALYCIYRCYKKMGDLIKCNDIISVIKQAIHNDERAKKMYSDYGDLMDEIKNELYPELLLSNAQKKKKRMGKSVLQTM
jgi:uncharacterized radical SAM superfamily protein